MKRPPTILQLEATECGAASLGMILGYYGRITSLDELRDVCGISRDGSTAANLMKAARTYGLEGRAYKAEPEHLRELDHPVIVFWRFAHFLVLERIHADRVLLSDPAAGRTEVTFAEFDESFTGIVLDLVPGPTFEPGGRRPSIVSGLRRRLQGAVGSVALLVLAGVLLSVPAIVTPLLVEAYVDEVVVGSNPWWTPAVTIGLVLAIALVVVVGLVQARVLLRLQSWQAIRSYARFVGHLVRLPMRFHTQRSPSDIVWRSALNDSVAQTLSGQLSQQLLAAITAGIVLVAMLVYSWPLGLVVVTVSAVSITASTLVAKRLAPLQQRLAREESELAIIIGSAVSNIESIKAGGTEADLLSTYAARNDILLQARQKLDTTSSISVVIPLVTVGLTSVVVLLVGSWLVLDDRLTLGQLVAFQAFAGLFLAPLAGLMGLGPLISELRNNLVRLDDVVDAPEDPLVSHVRVADSAHSHLAGRLELRAVTFGYDSLGDPVIRDFDLVAEPGQRIAIVGGSGSGKSTVSKLVAGLFAPWSGEILFDGCPRQEISRSVMAEGLAMVDQDLVLFEGTVRDNVTLFDPSIPDHRILNALEEAEILGVIAARTGGLDAMIREGGRNLSGGERQRLEIARALVRNPSIVILDEATSALDPATELRIDQALRRRRVTTIIVAHRLSTIRDADEIIVLDHGTITERGRHEQLVELDGHYARLVASGAAS